MMTNTSEEYFAICFREYGEQLDGKFLTMNGIDNSDYISLCKHYFCNECLKKIYNLYNEIDRCPLCREDITIWLKNHYYTSDSEDDCDDEE